MPLHKKIVAFVVISLFAVGYIHLFDLAMEKLFLAYNSSYWVYTPGVYEAKTEKGTSMYVINSLGIRGSEISTSKKGARILFLGDSMTLGRNVETENTFVMKSQEILRARGYHVENINAGIVGYGPANSLGLYRHLAGTVMPDVVLMCLTTNDVNESGGTFLLRTLRNKISRTFPFVIAFAVLPHLSNHVFKSILSSRMNLIESMNAAEPEGKEIDIDASVKKRLKKDMQKAQFLKKKNLTQKEARAMVEKLLAPMKKDLNISDKSYENWIENTSTLISENGLSVGDVVPLIYGLLEPDYFVKSIDLTNGGAEYCRNMFLVLRDLQHEVVRRGWKFGIIYLPQDLIYEEFKQRQNEKFNFVSKREWLAGPTRVEKELDAFCRKENIPFLNLTVNFRRLDDKRLTLGFDSHLNVRGHEKIAEIISEYVMKSFPGLY